MLLRQSRLVKESTRTLKFKSTISSQTIRSLVAFKNENENKISKNQYIYDLKNTQKILQLLDKTNIVCKTQLLLNVQKRSLSQSMETYS